MDLIFDDDTAVVGLVDNQLVGRLKRDVVAIAPELGHQIGAPLDNARPTSDVVENLVDDVISDDVEEVLALNEVAYRPSNQLEVRVGSLVGRVFPIRHPGLSMGSASRLEKESYINISWKLHFGATPLSNRRLTLVTQNTHPPWAAAE